MNHLLTIKQQDVTPDNNQVMNLSAFKVRVAARAVLLDANNQIYLLNVSLHGYHKLPGGGVNEGEEILEALARELMEEVGCRAEIVTELGTITEYRDYLQLKQTSYCYLARAVGEQIESALEEGELAEGMYEVRANDINEAITLLAAIHRTM